MPTDESNEQTLEGHRPPARILMIGIHEGYVDAFRKDDDLEFYVIEEPDTFENRRARYETYGYLGIKQAHYETGSDFVSVAEKWHAKIHFDAVVPSHEYAVPAAAHLSERWGTRFVGTKAINACTDKLRLRETLRNTNCSQPRFAHAKSIVDVEAFFEGKAIVLKPANRRASVGVVRVDNRSEIEDAWRICTSAGESNARGERDERFIVEEFLPGRTVTVETLTIGGINIFQNVTQLETKAGRRFAVTGVTVPAPFTEKEIELIKAAALRLSNLLQQEDGLLHSEWAVNEDGVHLIECAARVPGAFIAELVEQAYGFNLYSATIRAQAGRAVMVKPRKYGATIRYFQPHAGRLKAIDGLQALEGKGVFLSAVGLHVGQTIPSFEDSWHRAGYFGVTASDSINAIRAAKKIEEEINFTVEASQ